METTGRHLLIEYHGCEPAILNDREALRGIMREAARAASANVIQEVLHAHSPHGITGVFVIEESHFSLHTWPEAGYAAADFYTCGEGDAELAVRVLERGLRARRVASMEVSRGLDPAHNYLALKREPHARPASES